MVGIIALCESGHIDLIASDALVFETERNPYPIRKRHALEVLAKAALFVQTERHVEERARVFHALGIKPLDASASGLGSRSAGRLLLHLRRQASEAGTKGGYLADQGCFAS